MACDQEQTQDLDADTLVIHDEDSTCDVDVCDAQDICNLGFETGICKAYFLRWYYDANDGKCREFIYGGCGGNGNNFIDQGACETTCEGF